MVFLQGKHNILAYFVLFLSKNYNDLKYFYNIKLIIIKYGSYICILSTLNHRISLIFYLYLNQ